MDQKQYDYPISVDQKQLLPAVGGPEIMSNQILSKKPWLPDFDGPDTLTS